MVNWWQLIRNFQTMWPICVTTQKLLYIFLAIGHNFGKQLSKSLPIFLLLGLRLYKHLRCLYLVEIPCRRAQAWKGKDLKKTRKQRRTTKIPPSRKFRFGPTHLQSGLTVSNTAKNSTATLYLNGCLKLCTLMLL